MKVDPSVVYTREQVAANLKKAVAGSPISFDFLLKQAEIESGLNPNAKASTSSATGPFQFINGTWLNMIKKYGDHVGLSEQAAALRDNKLDPETRDELLALRTDVAISGKMAAHFAIENAKVLISSGLTQIGPTELYLAHFLGAGGAKDFLTAMQANPQGPAAEAVPAAARSNINVFYDNGQPRSFAEIYNKFAQKFASVAAPLSDGTRQSVLRAADLAQGVRNIASDRVDQKLTGIFEPVSDDINQTVSRFTDLEQGPVDTALLGDALQGIARQALSEARMTQAKVSKLQAEAMQQTQATAEEMTAHMAELSEAALTHYLSSFSKGFEDPSKTPIEAAQGEARDASQGASTDATMPMQGHALMAASGVALGTKVLMDSVGSKPKGSDHAAAEVKAPAPALPMAVKQAVEWVSLFSDTRSAEAANTGRA